MAKNAGNESNLWLPRNDGAPIRDLTRLGVAPAILHFDSTKVRAAIPKIIRFPLNGRDVVNNVCDPSMPSKYPSSNMAEVFTFDFVKVRIKMPG